MNISRRTFLRDSVAVAAALTLPSILNLQGAPMTNILGVDLAALPKSGAAYNRVKALAAKSGSLDYGLVATKNNPVLIAKAIMGDKAGVLAMIRASKSTLSASSDSLAVSRNLAATAIALSLVGAHEEDAWLRVARDTKYSRLGTLTSAAKKANNHGSAADQSLVAVDLHLGDVTHLAAQVIPTVKVRFGEPSPPIGNGNLNPAIKLNFGDLSFQAHPLKPVVIGLVGDVKQGISLDGCLAEEQRRQGTFPNLNGGNYNFGASGQLLLTAFMLERAGYGAKDWTNVAVKRVFAFFKSHGWAPSGDDRWQGHMVKALYGAGITPLAVGDGKTMACTDYLFG